MASRIEGGINFAKRYPRVTGGILTTILFFGGVGAVGIKVALDNGQNPFGPTGEIAPGPMIPGRLQPDTQPVSNIKPEAGCLVVNQGDTPAGLLAQTGERLYPGKRIRVIYSADGHGGGQDTFPAGNLEDLNKISKVIWADDQFCPENPVQLNFDNKNTTAIESTNEGCIAVNADDTIWGIVFNGSAYDGIKDDIVVKRIGLGSDGTTTKNKMDELDIMRPDIKVGDLVCLP